MKGWEWEDEGKAEIREDTGGHGTRGASGPLRLWLRPQWKEGGGVSKSGHQKREVRAGRYRQRAIRREEKETRTSPELNASLQEIREGGAARSPEGRRAEAGSLATGPPGTPGPRPEPSSRPGPPRPACPTLGISCVSAVTVQTRAQPNRAAGLTVILCHGKNGMILNFRQMS